MRIVSTCHKEGWDQYGSKTWLGMDRWPKGHDLRWYSEGYQLGGMIDNRLLPKLAAFKEKYAYYLAPDWRYDVVRFANKVYAAHDALYDYDGLGVWMDADIIAHEQIPDGYIESLLPEGNYIALFQREGWHSETGLWLVDCAHPQHRRFMDTLLANYETGKFAEAHEWHDCVMMDRTIAAFERDELIKSHNLSGPHSKSEHPMAQHPISRYMSHLKGPERKAKGRLLERDKHAA